MIKPLILMGTALSLAACLGNESRDNMTDTNDHDRAREVIFEPYTLDPEGRDEAVTIAEQKTASGGRQFVLESTQFQRDEMPKTREVVESADALRVETGDGLFDGLFAMAMDDLNLLSVDSIRDDQYNQGNEIACGCFQTGEKWHYVWTRDLAYAADLSLAYIDPERTVNSLLFKTSGFREEVTPPRDLPDGSRQIIQDTGSGGSWAVSTDRVSWAIAARRVASQLRGAQGSDFLEQTYAALRGTIEADRLVAYDPADGLYGGEQSFLDWRVQTYAPWITNNLSQMAESKALSTNVMHYQAIRLAADLAHKRDEETLSNRYSRWADDLRHSINKTFWLEDKGLYASLTSSGEVPVPVHKYDMLGTALAILYDVASPEQARAAMNHYPHAPFGVPVYFPQQPNRYVYHNRAIWPFVTAYALKAGAEVDNYKVVDNAVNSLMRGAALNVSNMENLEWLTAKPYYDDGPAINSRRQLWSVAGYLAMVMETVFGYQVEDEGIRIRPFLTTETRARLGDDSVAWLKGIRYRGNHIDVELNLPEPVDTAGYYPVAGVRLNGEPVSGVITEAMLSRDRNTISVRFDPAVANDSELAMVPEVDPLSHTDPKVFSPETPAVDAVTATDSGLEIRYSDEGNAPVNAEVRYNLYRNSTRVASGLEGMQWEDKTPELKNRRQCYAVEAVFSATGHRSQLSEPVCYTSASSQTLSVEDSRVETNVPVAADRAQFDQPVLLEWGKPGDTLVLNDLQIERAGRYAIRLKYNNRQHTIDSGVTNAIKRMVVLDDDGAKVAQRIVQMPNVEDREGRYPLRRSTESLVTLAPGRYRLVFEDYFNMSYLQSSSTYNAAGGQSGPVNTASIAAFEVMYLGEE